ncbi:uncharacterized protein PGTG_03307 [Puccinia graminis f. sp. tritici CRL 75-36-700-3]|uniref:Zn(2)-C6 fungal-type domain-containing protein n=1 Tax=Puccinia graminis f. sp. tritici (strain CRL 75-36-700-3 / race SCCL) TaxID=418459 RepID=E3JZ76_PUCGT|nr:uncharacterized protein PGTG_03307 [Puccinia graminis f. sp. tritici CRL 75-36-700-3]EFP77351.1 hypothetical protein PGTG_03307 [Puccinia graminis f. sp. tritici CRL 75-36-700-3]
MNNRSDYGPSSRSMIPPGPLNLPSIHLLFQMADSPGPIPQPSSLTLPPLRFSQACTSHRPFLSRSPSSPSSASSTRGSSSSTPGSSPHSQELPRPPAKRKQVKRACQNCQKHIHLNACKGCADTRPCPRCIIHGITESCVDAPRKSERKQKCP